MRRPALIVTALAATALALTACGGGGSGAGGDQQSLIDTAYSVTTLTVDGNDREVIGPVEIAFTADTISVMTPCNGMSGPVTYSESTLTVGPLAATKMACEPVLMDQDQVIADALAANPTWSLSGETLTLTGGGTVIVGDNLLKEVTP
jgi:heat shock protein HslJ